MNGKTTAVVKMKPPIFQGVIARFPRALEAIAEVSRVGTAKHNVPLDDTAVMLSQSHGEHSDAMMRHIVAHAEHGPFNEENGETILHDAQVAWRALARLEKWLYDREAKEARCGSAIAEVQAAADFGGPSEPADLAI